MPINRMTTHTRIPLLFISSVRSGDQRSLRSRRRTELGVPVQQHVLIRLQQCTLSRMYSLIAQESTLSLPLCMCSRLCRIPGRGSRETSLLGRCIFFNGKSPLVYFPCTSATRALVAGSRVRHQTHRCKIRSARQPGDQYFSSLQPIASKTRSQHVLCKTIAPHMKTKNSHLVTPITTTTPLSPLPPRPGSTQLRRPCLLRKTHPQWHRRQTISRHHPSNPFTRIFKRHLPPSPSLQGLLPEDNFRRRRVL